MSGDLRMLPGGADGAGGKKGVAEEASANVSPETQMRHFREVNASLLQGALDTWGEIWDQMQGSLTHGVMIVPEAAKNFEPECGWPEFLEKMWTLRHYLDHAKRFSDGRG